jgi:catechol 2,3-dioxygenase-like lactoylglutathione lyase family enzyme
MTRTTGFDHVATVTADLDRVVAFYQHVFDAQVTFEMAATPDHPRMVILGLGGGGALNVTEQAAGTITGDRGRPGGRGPIDHYGIAVASLADLDDIRQRLSAAGAAVGQVQRLGDTWSLFFRDPDGMELEVCTPVERSRRPRKASAAFVRHELARRGAVSGSGAGSAAGSAPCPAVPASPAAGAFRSRIAVTRATASKMTPARM